MDFERVSREATELIAGIETARGHVRLSGEEKSSEGLYRALLEESEDMIWSIDANGVFTFMNPAVEKLMGYSVEEVIGRPCIFLLDEPSVKEAMASLEARKGGRLGKGPISLELVHVRKDGTKFIGLLHTTPVMDSNGNLVSVHGITRDITALKQTEEALEKRILALTRPLSDGAGELRFEDLFDVLEVQQIQDAFAAATGVASIITATDGTPITRPSNFCRLCEHIIRKTGKGLANCYRSDAVLGRKHPDGPIMQPCLSGGLWDGGTSICVGDEHIANWLIGQVLDDSIDTEAMLQYAREIGADEEAFGNALNEVTRMPKEQFAHVCEALFLIARQLSNFAFQNVQQAREIAERKRVETALAESEDKFHSLYSNMAEGVALHEVVLDPQGNPVNYRIVDVNPQYESILQMQKGDIVGRLANEVYGTDIPPYLNEFCGVALTGVARSLEAYFTPMGKHFSISISPWGRTGFATIFSDITERKQAEESLRERTEELDQFFGVALDLLCIAETSGTLVRVNPQWEKTLGYTKEELEGRSFFDFIHPEDIEKTLKVVERLGGQEAVLDFINRYRCKDGQYRHIEWRSMPVGNRIYAAARDVTDRMRAEEALRESEERYRLLADNVRDMISLHDESGVYLYVSPSVSLLLGYRPEEVVGRNAYEFMHPEDVSRVEDNHRKSLLEGLGASIEYRLRRHDEGYLWFETNTRVIQGAAPGEPTTILAVSRDITERRRADEERRHLEMQVQQAQKLESLGVLAGGIAHDFNNMLMAILGNADLALQDLSGVSPARPMLVEIDRTAHRAAELCRQMLAYSGRGKFVLQHIDMSEVVKEMGHMLEVSISKKASLRYNLSENLPSIEADPTQVRQVVMNLIINSSEALGEQAGVISVSTGVVHCDASCLESTHLHEELPEGPYVYLEVTDTGCGMDTETIERIFDPFFTTKFTGRGLGLAAVLGIMRGHRGTIRVYSEPGKGTCFKVLFPASSVRAESVSEKKKPEGWRGSGTVLLVDDEQAVRILCQKMLERIGFDVLSASNGKEAIDLFKANAARVRCVLLDLTMPQMDGEETFGELRRVDPMVRVIMSSGYNEQDIVSRFSGKGLAGFIQKPYRLARMTEVFRSVLAGAEDI